MLRFLTAGESHGKAMLAILEGFPAGVKIDIDRINAELKRRQGGAGRGPRMKFEADRVDVVAGTRRDVSLGSPLALLVENKDQSIEEMPSVTSPRPGHADLAGALKYGFSDIRNVLERASARETVSRVAVGALCKLFLKEFAISIESKAVSIGTKSNPEEARALIRDAFLKKDTLGGIFQVTAAGIPVGLGTYVQADRRLDARIAAALMSVPGVKGVEFGLGFGFAGKFGSQVHDEIFYSRQAGFYRKTNNAGGFEGGMTNGEDIVIRCAVKPISTLSSPLNSVDILTKKATKATIQRADTCVVEATGVVGEAMLAFELANALIEKFGSDSLKEIKQNYRTYLKGIK